MSQTQISRRNLLTGTGAVAATTIFSGSSSALDTVSQTVASAEIPLVDHHCVVCVDLSKSMRDDPQDMITVKKGLAHALVSPNLQAMFRNEGWSNSIYALTAMFFAQNIEPSATYVSSNEDEARDFAQEVFWDFENNQPQPHPHYLGNSTNIRDLFYSVANLFEHEKTDLQIQSLSKSVIVAGDGVHTALTYEDPASLDTGEKIPPIVGALRDYLTQRHSAIIYGIPILGGSNYNDTLNHTARDVMNYYLTRVVTQEGVATREGFPVTGYPEDRVFPAYHFEEVQPAVEKALRLAMY